MVSLVDVVKSLGVYGWFSGLLLDRLLDEGVYYEKVLLYIYIYMYDNNNNKWNAFVLCLLR